MTEQKQLPEEVKLRWKPLFNRISEADKSITEPVFWEMLQNELSQAHQSGIEQGRELERENILSSTNKLLSDIDDLIKEIGEPTSPAIYFIKKFKDRIKENYYSWLKEIEPPFGTKAPSPSKEETC